MAINARDVPPPMRQREADAAEVLAAHGNWFVATLAKAKAGDGVALGDLLVDCGGFLRKHARHRLSLGLQSKLSDSDVIQEAHVRTLAGMEDFRGVSEASFKAWLMVVLRRVAGDFHRFYAAKKRDVEREIAIGDRGDDGHLGEFDLFARIVSPFELVTRAESVAYYAKVKAQLPKKQRRTIEMLYWEEMSPLEVSMRMRIGLAEVHAILDSARDEVRRHVRPCDQPPRIGVKS